MYSQREVSASEAALQTRSEQIAQREAAVATQQETLAQAVSSSRNIGNVNPGIIHFHH